MKKIVFVLTMLLMVSTALGRVEISCSVSDDEVSVSYAMSSGDANIPRAFGLNVTLDNDANIVSTSDFNPGYWVHPGSIVIDTNDPAHVDSNGTAILSSVDYPQAGGLVGPPDSNGMTIEMGSLYPDGDPNPGLSGLLFKFVVDADCNVAISGNTALGKVVMEDATEDDTLYTGCSVTGLGAGCATCRGDWDGDSTVELNQDVLPIIGKINLARFLLAKPDYNEADVTANPTLGPWNPCADWDGDGQVELNDDVLPLIGKINLARFLLSSTDYACNHPSIDP